jgi:hypothetical protein
MRMAMDVRYRLKKLGYELSWSAFLTSEAGRLQSYLLETKAPDLAPYLPMERIDRALGVGTARSFAGLYQADVLAKLGLKLHSYCYRFQTSFPIKEGEKEFPVYLLVEVSGRLSGPFPEGVPVNHSLVGSITVGGYRNPIPAGQDQKKLALSAAKRAVRAAEAFVSEFPDANVYVFLETREGVGGWRRKVVLWDLGSAQRLAQEEGEPWE